MLKSLAALWRARKGFRWSLFFVHRNDGLRYALHENAVIVLVGYVLAPIENGKRISEEWTLHINFNYKQKSIQLSEGDFIDGAIAPTLLSKINALDPGWQVEMGEPVFVDVKSGATLPLGMYGVTFQSERDMLHSLEELLSGAKTGPTLQSVMRLVFAHASAGSTDLDEVDCDLDVAKSFDDLVRGGMMPNLSARGFADLCRFHERTEEFSGQNQEGGAIRPPVHSPHRAIKQQLSDIANRMSELIEASDDPAAEMDLIAQRFFHAGLSDFQAGSKTSPMEFSEITIAENPAMYNRISTMHAMLHLSEIESVDELTSILLPGEAD